MVNERQLYFLPQRRNDHPGISADACFAAGGDQEANKELTGTLVETVLALAHSATAHVLIKLEVQRTDH